MQALESRNIHCVHKQVKDEDHFSVVEKLSDPNFSLTKVYTYARMCENYPIYSNSALRHNTLLCCDCKLDN